MDGNNGKKPRKAGRIVIRLFPVIILLVLVGIFSIPGISARMRTGDNGGDKAGPAKFRVYTDGWHSDSESSDSGSYSFTVHNGSEVPVNYSCNADWHGSGQVDITFTDGKGSLGFGESKSVVVTYVKQTSDSSGSVGVSVIATQANTL